MSKKTTAVNPVNEQIIKKYGEIFVDPEAFILKGVVNIPTTVNLDIHLKGGIPVGTCTLIAGCTQSGKSTLSLTIAANAQKMGQKIYYIDAENRVFPSTLKSIPGLDLGSDKLVLVKGSAEKILTAEDILNIINNLFTSEPNIMIILDSVATIAPEGALSAEHGESSGGMMGLSKLMYSSLRKLIPIMAVNKSNLILISHVTANPNSYSGIGSVTGGNAPQFLSTTYLACTYSKELPEGAGKDEPRTGRESIFKILKCGNGAGTGKSSFYIRYGHGYDKELDIARLAEELSLLKKAGAWYSYKKDDKEEKFQGINNFIEHLRKNTDIRNWFEKEIKNLVQE